MAARIRTVAGRVLLAALLTAALMGAAIGALFVTTAPRMVSVLIEPISVLLMPGLLISLAASGAHDFSINVVVASASVLYFAFFYWALNRIARARLSQARKLERRGTR
jgi:hypothetical protein